MNTPKESIGSKFGIAIIGIIVVAVVFFFVTWATGAIRYSGYFVSKDTAVKALTTHGFKDVVVVKRNCSFLGWRGGSDSDSVRFVCEAINPAGQRVTMYVFSGVLKGATIRTP
jgi:hypothetical protein